MAFKTFTIDFKDIYKDRHLRFDEKYFSFQNDTGWNIFSVESGKYVRLRDILKEQYEKFEFKEDMVYKGIPTGQSYIDADGYITDYQPITNEDHPNRLKYKASNSNILLSSLRLAKSPVLYFEFENLSEYVFSNGFYIFTVKNGWNIRFMLHLLRSKKLKSLLDNNIYRGIGISAYKSDDLQKIIIPLISENEQNNSIRKIIPIENNIKSLKLTIKSVSEIINEVFAREFNFDYNAFEQLKNEKNYYAELIQFANNANNELK